MLRKRTATNVSYREMMRIMPLEELSYFLEAPAEKSWQLMEILSSFTHLVHSIRINSLGWAVNVRQIMRASLVAGIEGDLNTI